MPSGAKEFEEVALPYTGSLLRFALRLTRDTAAAEDLVQETLLSGWRHFGQFERGTNARAWLFQILINFFRRSYRKERGRAAFVVLTPEVSSYARNELPEVNQALERIGEDQRAVLLLAAVEGFTCKEISEILSIPMGTVMSRLSRAREAMRAMLASGQKEQVTR